MNSRWSTVLMLGALLALPFGVVRAEEGGPQGGGDADGHHWMHGKGHGHDGMDLTTEQKSKLKAIMEAEEKALKPLKRKQRDLAIKLHDQLEDKAADSVIQASLSDLKSNGEAIRTESKRFKSQREAILTPTQQAKMFLMHMHRHEHDGWMGHEKMEMMEHGRDGHEDGGRDGDHHDRDDHDDGGDAH